VLSSMLVLFLNLDLVISPNGEILKSQPHNLHVPQLQNILTDSIFTQALCQARHDRPRNSDIYIRSEFNLL
ncbi:hypothetical protein BKA62DRAFT_716928, partial [Auriculariales sp. MPI-PUGE-AT-0066]